MGYNEYMLNQLAEEEKIEQILEKYDLFNLEDYYNFLEEKKMDKEQENYERLKEA